MHLKKLHEGFVYLRRPGDSLSVAAAPRCAVTPEGHVVCTFIAQSKLGINDFVLKIAVSTDGGITWEERGSVWPELQARYSICCSLSRAPSGELFLFGTRTPIDSPGESFWNADTQGLKQNELIWARSADGGHTWSPPAVIPMPQTGSAEAPGPMCVTRQGRWLACYAPYHTFDARVSVDRGHIVVVYSDDQGASWRRTSMIRFQEPDSGGAEAWVIELADGRLLGTCWHLDLTDRRDYPNPFALSLDSGSTWQPVASTGIRGQSTALAALPDGRALFIYNQRKYGEVGVWLACARPSSGDFGLESNQIVWRAEQAMQRNVSPDHAEWQDFAFGEPSVTVLPDRSLLVALWCVQPSGQGIRYVKLGFPA